MGIMKAYFDWQTQQDLDSRQRLRPRHQALKRGRSEAAAGVHCSPSEAVGEQYAVGERGATQGPGGGRGLEMQKLYPIIARAANCTRPVLIQGESGTGKEMVARSIHYFGPFRDKPFIPIDCGSLVPALIECALFGYIKGAFAGANHDGHRRRRNCLSR